MKVFLILVAVTLIDPILWVLCAIAAYLVVNANPSRTASAVAIILIALVVSAGYSLAMGRWSAFLPRAISAVVIMAAINYFILLVRRPKP